MPEFFRIFAIEKRFQNFTMIEFRALDVQMPDIDIPSVRKWIQEVITRGDAVPGDLVYLFCNDEHILKTNRQFLAHDYYTDIITFDYSRGKHISGDMVISLDTVRTNAQRVGEGYERELLRVIIHGILHLLGVKDKGDGEREIMEQRENEALALYYNR